MDTGSRYCRDEVGASLAASGLFAGAGATERCEDTVLRRRRLEGHIAMVRVQRVHEGKCEVHRHL